MMREMRLPQGSHWVPHVLSLFSGGLAGPLGMRAAQENVLHVYIYIYMYVCICRNVGITLCLRI